MVKMWCWQARQNTGWCAVMWSVHKAQGHYHLDEELLKAGITSSSNQKTSNIIDHATSGQHCSALTRERADAARAANLPITSYLCFACSLLVMDEAVLGCMKRKFDICYVMASSCSRNFYSFLMDGSMDSGKKLVLLWYCTKDAQEMRSCTRYLSLEMPMKADADVLIKCPGNTLQTRAGTIILSCFTIVIHWSIFIAIREVKELHTKLYQLQIFIQKSNILTLGLEARWKLTWTLTFACISITEQTVSISWQ